MFPIRDERGRMAGFGARILNPEDMPKFLNSPQTAVFDKGHLLYGLDRARQANPHPGPGGDRGRLPGCDRPAPGRLCQRGLADGHRADRAPAVPAQAFQPRIVLALDPDAAGDKATLRGLQVARQAMDHEQDPVFDARGLLGYEARLQADIRVTTLPPGMDPDEVVKRDPQEWERIVENARPVVMHVMETLAAGRNLDDPKVKNEIAAQVLPLIEDVPSAIERDTYRQRLARLLRVDERRCLRSPAGRCPPQAGRSPVAGQNPCQQPAQSRWRPRLKAAMPWKPIAWAFCCAVRICSTRWIAACNRKACSRLSAEDFQHADHQAIMRVFQDSVDQDMAEPLNFVFNSLSLPMMELADDLLARTTELDPNDDRVLEDLMRGLLALRKRKLDQEMEYFRYLIVEAQEQGDIHATQNEQTMVKLVEIRFRIDKAMKKYTSRSFTARPVAGLSQSIISGFDQGTNDGRKIRLEKVNPWSFPISLLIRMMSVAPARKTTDSLPLEDLENGDALPWMIWMSC